MFRRLCVSLFLVCFFMCGLPAQSPTQQLWWDANTETDMDGYDAYRGESSCPDPVNPPLLPSDCPQYIKVNTNLIPQAADPITFTDMGPLEFQVRYFYRVRSCNTSGECSGLSNEVDNIHANPNAPAVPGSLRKTEQGANMWLDWDDMEHVNAYNVYKSQQENDRGDLIATTVVSDHRDNNPGRRGPRWYRVTSVNENGESDPAGPMLYVGKP